MTKQYLTRLFFFVLVLVAAVSLHPWVTIVAGVVYIIIYGGVEMVVIGLAMDAYFGHGSGQWYHFTLLFAIFVLLFEVVRPHLSMYNR